VIVLYAATLFASAFLLFLVQPVIAKQILPWFGGSAAVWTTCLVFYQTALLGGYAYSDFVVRRMPPRRQVAVHTALLVLSLIALPIIPAGHWKPVGSESPWWPILAMLAATIGLPYFLLSTTSPLISAWLARARPGTNPYRLFALSNAASLLALVGYPFLLEPWSPTRMQAIGWSAGYALFVVLCIVAGWSSLARPRETDAVALAPRSDGAGRQRANVAKTAASAAAARTPADAEAPPTAARQALWATLAATASLLLLAVTNHITQDIAAVPLLWIVPLAIYLLTFILCFDATRGYRRNVFVVLLGGSLAAMAWTLADPAFTYALALHLGVFCTGLFVACMFCHGELVRSKPAPKYLTRFYLMIALGGAGGSVLVGIVAPQVLPAHFELPAGLVLVAALLLWQFRRGHLAFRVLGVAALIATVGCGIWAVSSYYAYTTLAVRNFYGVLRVREVSAGNERQRSLVSGEIRHGTQIGTPDFSREPTTYYGRLSGVGRLLDAGRGAEPLRVGVIGLGAGTLAAYGAAGDVYRFYEINPDVIAIAQRDFTFLHDNAVTIEIVQGDARLALEREAPQRFDVLVVDAFTGDAIPLHLLTVEALGVYRRHVKPGGVIAFHVTNRHLDFVPIVERLAHAQRLFMIHVQDPGARRYTLGTDWLLLSDRRESLERPWLTEAAKPIVARFDRRPWTDDYTNLVQALK